MKRFFFVLAVAIQFFSISALGQDAQLLRFAKEAAIVNEDGTLTPLRTAAGNLSMTFTVSAQGDAAKVKVVNRNPLQIVLRVYDASAAPRESITAFKMKAKTGKNRKAFLGAFGVKSKDVISFEADNYDDNCLILSFYDLEPGEYGLWLFKDAIERNLLGEHQMVFFGVE